MNGRSRAEMAERDKLIEAFTAVAELAVRHDSLNLAGLPRHQTQVVEFLRSIAFFDCTELMICLDHVVRCKGLVETHHGMRDHGTDGPVCCGGEGCRDLTYDGQGDGCDGAGECSICDVNRRDWFQQECASVIEQLGRLVGQGSDSTWAALAVTPYLLPERGEAA